MLLGLCIRSESDELRQNDLAHMLSQDLQRVAVSVALPDRPCPPSPNGFLDVARHLSRPETIPHCMAKAVCRFVPAHPFDGPEPFVQRVRGVGGLDLLVRGISGE